MLSVNPKKLSYMMAGAALVISGLALKTGYGNARLGMPAFILGLLVIAWTMGCGASMKLHNCLKTPRSQVGAAGAVAILISVVTMARKYHDKGHVPPASLGLLFIAGWIALGVSVGMGRRGKFFSHPAAWLGLAGSGAALFAMLRVLPRERMMGIVDNFGMPLLTFGFGALSLAHAIV